GRVRASEGRVTMTLDDARAREVLDFWLGEREGPYAFDPKRAERWFQKSPAFDEEIRRRFGALLEAAQGGTLRVDGERAHLLLAEVILLDQLSRNAWRDSPRMYAGDARALALVERALAAELERDLPVVERVFFYMPLMHSEELAHQEECVRRFEGLVDDLPPEVRKGPLGQYLET